MKTIHKYKLDIVGLPFAKMPAKAEILTLQLQNGIPCIWVLVDTQEETVERQFITFGTGEKLPDDTSNLKYVGTYQLHNGQLVLHLFEVLR